MTYSIKDLEYEINAIPDEQIRTWTRVAIQNCEPDFWTVPASHTGKYHPEDERLEGGTVIHTKRAYFVLQFLIEAERHWVDENLESQMLSAILLHDICRGEGRYHAEAVLPYYTTKLGEAFVQKYPLIMQMVVRHMGRWGEDKPITRMDQLVHTADNVASKGHTILWGFMKNSPNFEPPKVLNTEK